MSILLASNNFEYSAHVNESPSIEELATDYRSYENSNHSEEEFENNQDRINDSIEDMLTLHPNTECTVADALCMITAFVIRHNLPWIAVEDLLQYTNHIIGRKELTTCKHTFKKKVQKMGNMDMVKHFICHECGLYLGSADDINKTKRRLCSNCNVQIEMDTKFKKNHFITMPLKSHLPSILERNSGYLKFDFTATNNICDVHDSLYFQNMRKQMNGSKFVSFTFSVDGAVVHKSTKDKSLWPLQFIINEIDIEHRFKRENIFCSAISFGKTPKMEVFFKPFVEEIKRINAEGGIIFKSADGQTHTVKILPMIFTGDTPARGYVLNKVAFNGYMGCPYCMHEGTLVNRQIRYCKRGEGISRTNQQSRADMIIAQTTNEKVNGYHGVSPLMAFNEFDIVWQVGIDKMHCVDLGVVKLIFYLLLDRKFRHERYIQYFESMENILV